MKLKKITILLLFILTLNASGANPLGLDAAIEKIKTSNLEIKAAVYDEKVAEQESSAASGMMWGKLDLVQDIARSNDAGNVFGFKLTSREATFNDFGFDFTAIGSGLIDADAPIDGLNNPDESNFFQTRVRYEVPLYVGGMITSYSKISKTYEKLKTLDKQAVINEKIFEIKKSYYDMALLDYSVSNLEIILDNIQNLEIMANTMIEEGYAKNIDLLEVQSKKSKIARLLNQLNANKEVLYQYISFLLNEETNDIILPTSELQMPEYTNQDILNSNVEMSKARTALEIRKEMVRLNKASYLPVIGAFAEVGTASTVFFEDASEHASYTVGGRMTWNIFNGGVDNSKLQAARIEHLKIQTQVEIAKKGIALQAQKIKTEIKSLDYDIESLELEFKLASSIYSSYEERYKEQLASMSDVIIKQSEQIEKVLELQEVKNKRNQKIFDYEKLANQGE